MLRPTCKPNIPATERVRFSKCAGCLVVQQKSIDITEMDKICSKVHSQFCSDMFCSNCSATFRLFFTRDAAFVGRIQPGAEPPFSTDKNDPIPPPARRLLAQVVKKDPPEAIRDGPRLDNDADIERMFGNSAAPVVGSYKDNTIVTNRELDAIVSENAPKSYFA